MSDRKNPAGRPRMYNSNAEKQAAYRERKARKGGMSVSVEIDPETAERLREIMAKTGDNAPESIRAAIVAASEGNNEKA